YRPARCARPRAGPVQRLRCAKKRLRSTRCGRRSTRSRTFSLKSPAFGRSQGAARFVHDAPSTHPQPVPLPHAGVPPMMAASIHAWVEALEEAALEVVELALGFGASHFVAKKVAAPRNVAGAYLPLFGGMGESLYIGWLASTEASHALACGLLG